MIGDALLLAITFFIGLAVVLLERLKFLAPYKYSLFHLYGNDIGLFALLLFLNSFSLFFVILRRFRLKNTGQKLMHLDKQVKTGHSALSQEIQERYEE